MWRVLVALLVAFTLQIVVGPQVEAQNTTNCTVYDSFCILCGDPILPGQHNCIPMYPFFSLCEYPAWWCVPPAAASETCPTCSTGQSAPSTPALGKPVSIATGNTYIQDTDVSIPGLGGGLSLARQWNSLWPSADSAYQIGIFGPNWRSTYEEQVFVGSDYYFKYLMSDGAILSFGYGPGAPTKWTRWNGDHDPFLMLATPVSLGHSSSLGTSGGGGGGASVYVRPTYFSLMYGNGEEHRFDINTGKLIALIDRNGNETSITYNSVGHVDTVTDPASRHLYFHYDTGTNSLVTSITTDFGVTVSYSYDTSGRLTQVTEPDSSTISYVYDTNSKITSVLDSNGHVLETHTYDASGRGLAASQAGGVNSVTLSYSN
jgi:YD repeat-containing protein